MGQETVEFDGVEVRNGTPSGWWMVVEGEEVFIPESQIEEGSSEDISEGDTITLVIPEWLALEKGLI